MVFIFLCIADFFFAFLSCISFICFLLLSLFHVANNYIGKILLLLLLLLFFVTVCMDSLQNNNVDSGNAEINEADESVCIFMNQTI